MKTTIKFTKVTQFNAEYGTAIITFSDAAIARKAALNVLNNVTTDIYLHNNTIHVNIGNDAIININKYGYFITFR